jgi:hypothetical protein
MLKKSYRLLPLMAPFLFSSVVGAVEYEVSVGMHDFMVMDIVDDVAADGISAGTSHTFGINTAIYVKHQTERDIKFLAKAEAFLDNDKDHLDPDHISIWFDFLLDINGPVYSINENHSFRWYILADNKQNTVSCIEREVRQHFGLGYEFANGGLTLDLNVYAGFYYIEIDDDTPIARGYTRQDTDDGEASHVIEIKGQYDFNKNWTIRAYAKRYAANAGAEMLEDNYELFLAYKNLNFITDGSALNFKVKHVEYNFDRFYLPSAGVPILPFDNDTLIQAYVTFPISF